MDSARRALVLTLVAGIVGCTPDGLGRPQSAHTMPIGTTFQNTIQVGRATVPLPPGEWVLAAAQEGKSGRLDGGVRNSIPEVHLYKFSQVSGQREIDGTIVASATGSIDNVLWSKDSECARTDWLFVDNQWRGDQEQSCTYIRAYSTNWRYGQNWSDISKRAIDWLVAQKIPLNQTTFLLNRFRYVRGPEFVSVYYYASTKSLGLYSTSENDWHPVSRQSRTDAEKIFSERVAWGRAWGPQVLAGLEGKLQSTPTASPVLSSPQSPTVPTDRAARLRELVDLRQKGLITEDEFQSRRSRVLEGL